jgi:hypothetical protein
MRVATSFVQAPLNLKTLTRARCVGLNFRRCRRMFLMFLKPWYRAAAMLEALEDAVLLAMFADIHANRTAFEACLAAPRAEGRADDLSRRLQKRPVDLLNVDAAVLHRLDGVGDLHQLARGDLQIGEGAIGDEFHEKDFFFVSLNGTGSCRRVL